MVKWTKIILATIVSFLICYYWGEFSGYTGFSFAWIINFVLMAWFTYIDSQFDWKYNSSYFDAKAFEKRGAIYTLFGVHYFRKLLVLTGWEKISRKNILISHKKSALIEVEAKSRSSEAGHGIIFVIVALVTVVVSDNFRDALWLILLNLLLNVYPIFVQRYNRPRYRRLIQKLNLRTEKT